MNQINQWKYLAHKFRRVIIPFLVRMKFSSYDELLVVKSFSWSCLALFFSLFGIRGMLVGTLHATIFYLNEGKELRRMTTSIICDSLFPAIHTIWWQTCWYKSCLAVRMQTTATLLLEMFELYKWIPMFTIISKIDSVWWKLRNSSTQIEPVQISGAQSKKCEQITSASVIRQ